MEFVLSEQEKLVRETARDFAQEVLLPRASRVDDDKSFGPDTIEILKRHEYLGIMIPDVYDGGGMSGVEVVLVTEQIARACLSTAAILGAHNLVVHGLLLMGNDQQKKRYLPQLASGERIGALGLTEANAGSDVVNLATTATREEDEFVINGSKQFITNGGLAGLVLVFAVTDRSRRGRGISAFLVETETTGFSVGKEENKMGIRGTSTGQIILDNCRVPTSNLLGKVGDGFKLAMMILDRARPNVGAQALGVAQAALDMAIQYSKERVVFGQPLSEVQTTRFTLADMATQLEAARLLVYRAATLAEAGTGRFSKESSMAKLFASEVAHFVVDHALQIHGGYGYMKEYPIERLYRDQRILEIYEGTSEIQRLVIARSVLE